MRTAVDDAFDMALLHHGYTDYIRDYELIIQFTADPSTGIETSTKRYLFTHCVSANARTSVPPSTWAYSLDERLIEEQLADDVDGYVWGVRWQVLYPGIEIIAGSESAHAWEASVGVPFFEAVIESNGHTLNLIFSDLRVEEVCPGYAPFVLGEPFRDGKIPL